MFKRRNKYNLDNHSSKTGLIILSIFSLVIIVFWFLQMQANIKGPFQLGDEYSSLSRDNTNNIGTCSGPDCLNESTLREQDTDNDGLSDWEEANIYGTSAYLADSDSDGISDITEIENGTDPNCAEGTNCDVNQVNSNIDVEAELNRLSENITVPEDEAILEEALSGNIDADSLRSLMLESGVEADLVESFSDEELMSLYQETLSQQETN